MQELIKLQETHQKSIIEKKVQKKTAKKLDNNFRILCLFCSQKAETNTLLGLTSLLMAFGFLFGIGNNSNYDLIYAVLSSTNWAIVFTSYAAIKIISCVTEVSKVLRYSNSAIGIWAWMCIFLSFALFDTSDIAPTEVLLLMPVIAEMWVMTSIFDFNPSPAYRLQNNTETSDKDLDKELKEKGVRKR